MKKYNFERIKFNEIDTEEYYNFEKKTVFTTLPWLNFVMQDSKVTDFILRICNDKGNFVGYFTGFITKKFGVKILGSPFAGWSTCFMGLDLVDYTDKCQILREVVRFARKTEKISYAEIVDRNISVLEAKHNKLKVSLVNTLQLDINKDNDGLFKQMKTDCRNFIRQFERRGASLEIANPDDSFAEEYYNQLIDVFAKQGMKPTYSLEKVKCLLRNLSNSDEVLCLRVRNPEGESIATSLFFGYNKTFFFWGGASYRSQQSYRPNEYMIWTAMQYWRERGCDTFDMVGVRDYKKKFGSTVESYARITFSYIPFLNLARNIAKKLYFLKLKLKNRGKNK